MGGQAPTGEGCPSGGIGVGAVAGQASGPAELLAL